MPQATGKTYDRRTVTACKRAYENTKTSFGALRQRFGVPKSVLWDIAKREGWRKFERSPSDPQPGAREAREVETAILVEGLQPHAPAPDLPKPRKRGGRPQKYLRLKDAAPLTDEQRRLKVAREEWEAGGWSFEGLAKKYGFSSGKVRYAAKLEGWTKRVIEGPPPVSPPPADPPAKPASAAKGWSAVKQAADVRTADIIAFPGVTPEPAKKVASVQLLPERSSEEKAQLRVTLAAIRAAMSVEQVQQLEHHQALLARYSHLIEVYLEPARFADTTGLSVEDAAEKVVATQKVALHMLLPTERDTLAGAVKVLTEALGRSIMLKRSVAGLDRVSAGAFRPGAQGDPLAEDDGKGKLLDLDAMDTGQLRVVQNAMETLDRHHRRQLEPPKPPKPDSIDDLLGPEPVVVQEPEEELPPR